MELEKTTLKKTSEKIKKIDIDQKSIDELSILFGYHAPPSSVHAIGRDKEAAVWWNILNDHSNSEILGFEVHRYRKDHGNVTTGEWKYKGYVTIPVTAKTQYLVESLSNYFQYKFTIRVINQKGIGPESSFSNEVLIEPHLPQGPKIKTIFFYITL